jgi:predicted acylesterase/phospholipase RssA
MKYGKNKASPSRLFCRSGGGLPGLDIHAGIWLALTERGITSSVNAGASAGAIVSAFDSAGYRAEKFQLLLTALSDSDVRRERPFWRIRSLLGMDHFLDPAPLERLLNRFLPAAAAPLQKRCDIFATRESDARACSFSFLPPPLRSLRLCGATSGEIHRKDAKSAEENNAGDAGPLHPALLASCAIPGVWPKRRISGTWYSDGGTSCHLPIPSDWLEFDEVYLLVANPPLAYKPKSESVLSRLFLAAHMLIQSQIERTIANAYALADAYKRRNILNGSGPTLILIRPDCGHDAGSLRFRHSLIHAAYMHTARQLDSQLAIAKGKTP